MNPCISTNDIAAIADGNLPAHLADQARTHMEECSACRTALAGAMCSSESEQDDDDEIALEQIERGECIAARYQLLEPIGRGAMGRVYRALDGQLARTVAIKVLDNPITDRASAGHARFLREAQAAAGIDHDHVVRVYDAGIVEGAADPAMAGLGYIVMEWVPGGDLAAWLREHGRPRRTAAIIDVFVKAGQGLAAAHAVGIVHRDFKPQNVLVGSDGRVCVTDFGLARRVVAGGDSADAPPDSEPATEGQDHLVQTITEAGALVGTPAYMSPEQFARQRAGPRSDQYSFCAALWEALFGSRPHAGHTASEIRAAQQSGQLALPVQRRGAARRLDSVLRRGLQVQPADRFPSMNALLEAILRAHKRPRRIALAAVVAVAALAVAAFAMAGPADPSASKWAEDAHQRALASSYPPLMAESLYQLAALSRDKNALRSAWSHGQEAALIAEESNHQPLLARSLTLLAAIGAEHSSQVDHATPWARRARAAIRRIGGDPVLQGTLDMARAQALLIRGDVDGALAMYQLLGLEYASAEIPISERAALRVAHGRALFFAGRFAHARERAAAAVGAYLQSLGPHHPDTIESLYLQSLCEAAMGNYDAADRLRQRVRSYWHSESGKRLLSLLYPHTERPVRRIRGVVVDSAGKRVAGARVVSGRIWDGDGKYLLANNAQALFMGHHSGRTDLENGIFVSTTDPRGRFVTSMLDDATALIAAEVGDRRSLAIRVAHGHSATLVVQPTGALSGIVHIGKNDRPAFVEVNPASETIRGPMARVAVGHDGGFRFERLAAGHYAVAAVLGLANGSARRVQPMADHVRVEAGRETRLDASRTALPATGRRVDIAVVVNSPEGLPLPFAQVFLLRGSVVANTVSAMLDRMTDGRSVQFGFVAAPGAARFEELAPGPITLCVIPHGGDVRDPEYLDAASRHIQDNAETFPVHCQSVQLDRTRTIEIAASGPQSIPGYPGRSR